MFRNYLNPLRKIIKTYSSVRMSSTTDLSSLRFKYKDKSDAFMERDIKPKEPFSLFKDWLETATATEGIQEPNAMHLATVSKDGQPSNRPVLLKFFSKDGFTFFTNYGSRKAREIELNPRVAFTMYWYPLRRAVRVEGSARKISKEDSIKYFHERPRASQIGALTSPQSEKIPNREYLDEKECKIKEELGPSGEVPIPNWGGYLIEPTVIEFWQGQTDRLHDRIRFRKVDNAPAEVDGHLTHQGEDGWVYERLAP